MNQVGRRRIAPDVGFAHAVTPLVAVIGGAAGNLPGHGPPSRSRPDFAFRRRAAPNADNRHRAGASRENAR